MKKPHTKDVIAQTVFELLHQKTISDITVTEIANEVGVSARTFYNCFTDKFDVCNYIYDELLKNRCWLKDGKRSTLNEFFDRLMDAIRGDYALFFQNTMCYTGQSSICEHIVSQGVEDLKDQLRLTGNADLITPDNIKLMQFYLRGLCATLQVFNNAGATAKMELLS